MVIHPGAQILERSPLQLLHRALAAPEGFGDLTDRFLLGETHLDHAALVGGKRFDEPEE
jgi:hypothetical protein